MPTERALVRLVAATAVTNAGSMLTALAFPLAAIGLLGATASELAALRVAGLLPGLALGPWLARSVDRSSARRVLIAAELTGAAAVFSVVLAHAFGALSLPVLAVCAFALGAASFAFGVARVAVVPGLVGTPALNRANGALRTAEAASEGVAFAAGGALVQAVGAPVALGLDTLSFLGSAALLRRLPDDAPADAEPGAASRRPPLTRSGLMAGARRVAADPVLRALALASALVALAGSITSVVYLLFATRTLGFEPAVLGLVFALGSLSSVAGGALAARAIARLGAHAMAAGLAVFGLAALALPFAPAATGLGLVFLALHQIGDGFYIVYDVAQTGTQQRRVPRESLGHVNGALRMLAAAATLIGAGLGGLLGDWLGPRATLACAAGCLLAGAAVLAGAGRGAGVLWAEPRPDRRPTDA